jgi:hypothetical protein
LIDAGGVSSRQALPLGGEDEVDAGQADEEEEGFEVASEAGPLALDVAGGALVAMDRCVDHRRFLPP